MICPRCRGKNTEEDKTCQHCGLKLKTVCPRCKALNKIGQARCTGCNLMLIRYCPQCRAPNFPNVKNCRKCGFELIKKKKAQTSSTTQKIEVTPAVQTTEKPAAEKIQAQTEPEEKQHEAAIARHKTEEIKEEEKGASPQEAQQPKSEEKETETKQNLSSSQTVAYLSKLVLKADSGCMVGISAPNGTGKSSVISSVTQNLKDEKLIWLVGSCQPDQRFSPYSFFRDIIKTLFGMPAITTNVDEARKSLKNLLESNLGSADDNLLNILSRILFSYYENCSEDIFKNKEEVQLAINQLITLLGQKANIVLLVEDLEFIDSASLECIKLIAKKGFLDRKNFIIVSHRPEISIQKQFLSSVTAQKLLSISLTPPAKEESEKIMLGMLNNQDIIPAPIKAQIHNQSGNLPLYSEQALWYLFQLGAIYPEDNNLKFSPNYKDIQIPADFSDIMMERFNIINKTSPEAIKVLQIAALIGAKFPIELINAIAGMPEESLNKAIQALTSNGLIVSVDQAGFRFKHNEIWKTFYERAFSESDLESLNAKLLEVYEKIPGTYSGILARLAEETEDYSKAIQYYNIAAQESNFLGDVASCSENQLKVLDLLPKSNLQLEEQQGLILAIEENLGKINYEANPQLAMERLARTIEKYEKIQNSVKIIDLTGYLARSCEITGNYLGVLECVDKALTLVENKEGGSLEQVLLTFSKLNAAFHLGRFEEVVMAANNDILPALNQAVLKKENFPGLEADELKDIIYETELILARTYAFQGNKQVLELADLIVSKAEKEEKIKYEAEALLLKALYKTLQGDNKQSNAILSALSEKGAIIRDSYNIKLYWFFIAIISNFINGNFEQARNICYSGLSLASECKNYTIYTLIKLLMGKCYQHFQYFKNALGIYDEIVTYCSENKLATGALYSWYLAAESELQMGNPDKARDIAERAMDISQKSNINNTIATILLSRLIAEVRTIKGDFEGAQINIESALELAMQNDLDWILAQIYLTYGKIYQENASNNEQTKVDSANSANKLYHKALEISEKLGNQYLADKVEKELSNLNAFCNLSGIKLADPT